jgi:hypothetical protein
MQDQRTESAYDCFDIDSTCDKKNQSFLMFDWETTHANGYRREISQSNLHMRLF